MTGSPVARPARKRRRWLFYGGFFVLGVVATAAVVALGWYWYVHTTNNQLVAAAVASVDKTDPGWKLQDLEAARETIPDDENGALCVKATAKSVPRDWPPEGLKKELQILASHEPLNAELMAGIQKSVGQSDRRPR